MPTAQIDWRHNRERLLLPIFVFPGLASDNPFESIRLEGLLDTGATGTGIRADVARTLRLRQKGLRRVYTANGDIVAAEYLIRIGFACGDYRDPLFEPDRQQPYVLDRETIGFELGSAFSYEAVIGMDILGSCDLSIFRDGTASLVLG